MATSREYQEIKTLVQSAVADDTGEGLVFSLQRRREAAAHACTLYSSLESKAAFLKDMATDILAYVSVGTLVSAVEAESCASSAPPTSDASESAAISGATKLPISVLRQCTMSIWERFFQVVIGIPKGVAFAISFRGDLLKFIRAAAKSGTVPASTIARLRTFDATLQYLFLTQQSMVVRKLEVRTIATHPTLASFLMKHEAVHPEMDHERFLARFRNSTHLSFALFHPSMPHQPLAVTYIRQSRTILTKVADVLSHEVESEPPHTTALFYSVNNTFAGLQGLQVCIIYS